MMMMMVLVDWVGVSCTVWFSEHVLITLSDVTAMICTADLHWQVSVGTWQRQAHYWQSPANHFLVFVFSLFCWCLHAERRVDYVCSLLVWLSTRVFLLYNFSNITIGVHCLSSWYQHFGVVRSRILCRIQKRLLPLCSLVSVSVSTCKSQLIVHRWYPLMSFAFHSCSHCRSVCCQLTSTVFTSFSRDW